PRYAMKAPRRMFLGALAAAPLVPAGLVSAQTPSVSPEGAAMAEGLLLVARRGPTLEGSRLVLGDDVVFASVREQGALLRARKIGAMELTEAYLQRLEATGPRLAAVVTVTRELALAQAHRAQQEMMAGRYRGPLHGIPYGAKDLLATKGIPTTWGAAPFRTQVFDHDATVVEKLRDGGAILLGKLAMIELA